MALIHNVIDWLRIPSLGFLGVLLAVAVACGESPRPNILLITSEDHGPELGCYGEPYVKTPRLDALAQDGVRFDRAYVTQAGCSPSRASILTGLYPHQNGQIGLATWGFHMYSENTPNLPRSLQQAGYRTGIIGKLHINPESAFPFDFKAIPDSNKGRKNLPDYARNAGRFMRTGDEPFFLMVNYPDAHRPFLEQAGGLPREPLTGADVKPIAYLGVDHPKLREDTANHYNCIMRVDSLIGDLLDALEQSGKADNTLVIHISDHGADLLRGKTTCYEGGLRVPLILSWPGRIQSGQVRKDLVSAIDLYPTILEAAGISGPSSLPGRSLVSLLRGESPEWRKQLFGEYHLQGVHNFQPQRSVRGERYKLIHNLIPDRPNASFAFAMRTHYGKLAGGLGLEDGPAAAAYRLMRQPPEYELYDLREDPFEFRNLSGDDLHREILEDLKRELAEWRRATDDPLLNPEILDRLRAEIEAPFEEGGPEKTANRKWHYPDYFFPPPATD
jgi:N-sulfoglucosamine sulfohydrolase